MGGFFGVASRKDCTLELFYGVDYHSHLGTRRGGMATYGANGFSRAIHNIENSPFRTKFERDVEEMEGNLGIGCISDYEPQPLLIQSHLGSFAITTVGKINNMDQLLKEVYGNGRTHFQEMSTGQINATELAASLICSEKTIPEGIRHLQDVVDGSMTLLLLTKDGIYAARDKKGRTPLVIGKKEGAYCASFENFAYLNLGYTDYHELGPGEIDFITPESVEMLVPPQEEMKICSFLWVYYGYPTASYEGINVEEMRYHCGAMLAKRDAGSNVHPDLIAGVPDSGIAHAIGYANESKVPFARPFIKYTPTWPRSFMPTNQEQRNLIARMKLIPVQALIDQKKLLLIDDSIVRGTQLRETVDFLYESGAEEVHMRSACPPIMYSCKYLNFSRGNSDMELLARRVIQELEGDEGHKHLDEYSDSSTERGQCLLKSICEKFGFDSLGYQSLDGVLEAIGIDRDKVCTYCWNGKE